MLSSSNALDRIKLIIAQLSSFRDLGSSSFSSSSESAGSGGAFARVLAEASAASRPVLSSIQPLGNSVQENVFVVKIVLRSGLPFLVNCLCKAPSPNVAAARPGTRKIVNARGSLSCVVAEELLKSSNLEDAYALPLLTSAL
jgi:hypothetical protein